jgi:hypothetical protein
MLRNWDEIGELRAAGLSWAEIAEQAGEDSGDRLRMAAAARAYRARKACGGSDPSQRVHGAPAATEAPEQGEEFTELLTAEDICRITSLEDLVDFFRVDRSRWQVKRFRVNKWEQASRRGENVRITPLYQVRAELVRSLEDQQVELESVWRELLADIEQHAPAYHAPLRPPLAAGEPCLLELAVMDPHIGMLAWGRETGESYDSDIAVSDYAAAIDSLLGHARLYPVERVLFVAGNDFLHVDAPGLSSRGGSTTAGTPQDVDGRLARMFTTARRALIAAIEKARTVAPVDVLFVPGNHDTQQTYRMAEVVSAWFRHEQDVNVIYGPQKRHYYGYGENTLMFTHGEEYRRQRDSLPLIFATECPPELWVRGAHREIHTGHFHIKQEGRYTPTSDVSETRAIRTRSLPGLTASDAWHANEGYRHRRTATALVFRRSGGIAGLHEFNP